MLSSVSSMQPWDSPVTEPAYTGRTVSVGTTLLVGAIAFLVPILFGSLLWDWLQYFLWLLSHPPLK
jgi:hypothetical protein